MAKSKKKTIESLAAVKNVGPKYAEAAYDELGIRSIEDLISAAEKGELQKLSGIGAKKEKAILESARGSADPKPAKTPSKPKKSSKPSKSKSSKSKSSKSKSSKSSKSGAKSETKADKPKAKKEKPAAKKEEAKKPEARAKNDDKKASGSSSTRPRPQSNYRPRERKKSSSNPIVFIGKLVFKIAKKLLS